MQDLELRLRCLYGAGVAHHLAGSPKEALEVLQQAAALGHELLEAALDSGSQKTAASRKLCVQSHLSVASILKQQGHLHEALEAVQAASDLDSAAAAPHLDALTQELQRHSSH